MCFNTSDPDVRHPPSGSQEGGGKQAAVMLAHGGTARQGPPLCWAPGVRHPLGPHSARVASATVSSRLPCALRTGGQQRVQTKAAQLPVRLPPLSQGHVPGFRWRSVAVLSTEQSPEVYDREPAAQFGWRSASCVIASFAGPWIVGSPSPAGGILVLAESGRPGTVPGHLRLPVAVAP